VDMKRSPLTIESALYLLAFGLALVARLSNLEVIPLLEAEAGWALRAWEMAQGGGLSAGSQPAYVALTGLLFSFLGSSDALARLLPALVGSTLIWLPYFFRDHLGRVAGLVVAFGLALDPTLVALSRQAGGPIMAVTFTLLAVVTWSSGAAILAGVLVGLALLSGPSALLGVLGLALAWGVGQALASRESGERTPGFFLDLKRPRDEWVKGLAAAVVTVLVVATLFFRHPEGLSGLGQGVVEFTQGWFTASGEALGLVLLALVVYQPLAALFGLAAVFRGAFKAGGAARFWLLWAASALALALLHPARGVGDLAWVLIPLWALAAYAIAPLLNWEVEERVVVLGQTALVFLLLVFIWLDLAGLSTAVLYSELLSLRLAVAAGVVALGIVATVLVGYGWSFAAARRGLAWGALAFFSVYLLATGFGAVQQRLRQAGELWWSGPTLGRIDLLASTLENLEELQGEAKGQLEVVYQVDAASLHWYLRDVQAARYASEIDPESLPAVIIALKGADDPRQAAAYRGQDFVWHVYPGWEANLPVNWVSWLYFRDVPQLSQDLVLWARTDIFPGGVIAPEPDDLSSEAPADDNPLEFEEQQ